MSSDHTPHECTLPWCVNVGTVETDHWQAGTYLPGRLSQATTDTAGRGAALPAVADSAGTIDGTPAVTIHIDDAGPGVQADLTVTDARRLRDQLEQAICNAEQISTGGAA